MRLKKLTTYIFVFAFMFYSLNIVMAFTASCDFKNNCDTKNTIMLLSDLTNAHGELVISANYDNLLCCNFPDSNGKSVDERCTGKNKIIGLSDATNAHGEIASETTYPNDVCFSDFECRESTACDDDDDEIRILSLSANTNAHLGNFTAYDTKICCKAELTFWSDSTGEVISTLNPLRTEESQVYLMWENTGLDPGTAVEFEILEQDTIFDDIIITLPGTVDANRDVNVSWTVSVADLSAATEPFEGGEYTFFFNAREVDSSEERRSNNLDAGGVLTDFQYEETIICGDYKTKSECGQNLGKVSGNPEAGCGEQVPIEGETGCYYLTDCACVWDDNIGNCNSKTEESLFGTCDSDNTYPISRGKCVVEETTTDDCNDGFLTYSWIANWNWQDNNYSSTTLPWDSATTGVEPFENPVGSFHYPNSGFTRCEDKSQTIPCPAQIQLPFFGFFNFLITFLLIGVIYGLIILKNESH